MRSLFFFVLVLSLLGGLGSPSRSMADSNLQEVKQHLQFGSQTVDALGVLQVELKKLSRAYQQNPGNTAFEQSERAGWIADRLGETLRAYSREQGHYLLVYDNDNRPHYRVVQSFQLGVLNYLAQLASFYQARKDPLKDTDITRLRAQNEILIRTLKAVTWAYLVNSPQDWLRLMGPPLEAPQFVAPLRPGWENLSPLGAIDFATESASLLQERAEMAREIERKVIDAIDFLAEDLSGRLGIQYNPAQLDLPVPHPFQFYFFERAFDELEARVKSMEREHRVGALRDLRDKNFRSLMNFWGEVYQSLSYFDSIGKVGQLELQRDPVLAYAQSLDLSFMGLHKNLSEIGGASRHFTDIGFQIADLMGSGGSIQTTLAQMEVDASIWLQAIYEPVRAEGIQLTNSTRSLQILNQRGCLVC
ncbi:MAG: hypothetical protein EA369_00940 [Bradymonadales bacterium]|nr:MAG: hypothetical protein EA369_00940 [Bradymonadales bacterium]